jgi:hypothetical protein
MPDENVSSKNRKESQAEKNADHELKRMGGNPVAPVSGARDRCHPERYSAKDLAPTLEARSFASTLRMTADMN